MPTGDGAPESAAATDAAANAGPAADGTPPFAVESYLRYQGAKLVERFDAACYVRLTEQMDTHDLARGRGPYPDVLGRLTQPTLVLGIDSDVLYPLPEQEELAQHLPHATLGTIHSPDGHDAFLIAFEALAEHIAPWLATHAAVEVGA
jgi:homoserine O-acetyltransferase